MKLGATISEQDKKICDYISFHSLPMGRGSTSIQFYGTDIALCLVPAFEAYYKTKEEQIAAFMRHHTCWVNITQEVITFVIGLNAAMEKQAGQDPNFDTGSINTIKLSLMGPMCAIGDTIFISIIPIVMAGVCIPLAEQGNIIAPFLFVLVFEAIMLPTRWYLTKVGFSLGTSLMTTLYESGILQKFMVAMSIVGLTVVGALAANYVRWTFTLQNADGSINLQNIADSIFQGLMPMLLTLGMFYLARYKRFTPMKIVGAIYLFCFVAALLHLVG